jgi:hypothetical protein
VGVGTYICTVHFVSNSFARMRFSRRWRLSTYSLLSLSEVVVSSVVVVVGFAGLLTQILDAVWDRAASGAQDLACLPQACI